MLSKLLSNFFIPVAVKWKLVKAEVDGESVLPNKYTWTLDIMDSSVGFNWACNGCSARIILINDSIISLSEGICTMKGCLLDQVGDYIDYNGKYKIINDTLRITNTKATLYLARLR